MIDGLVGLVLLFGVIHALRTLGAIVLAYSCQIEGNLLVVCKQQSIDLFCMHHEQYLIG